MILTELHKGQGLGNQLWCYATCRSISEHLNMPYMILGRDNFKGSAFLDIEYHSRFIDDDLENEKQELKIYFEKVFYDNELGYTSSGFDSSVEHLKSYTKIEGLFQSEKYFFGDNQKIISYFKIKEELLSTISIDNDICILNIRGGEYKKHRKFILPKSYWQNAIKNMKDNYGINKFLIVTDDPDYSKLLLPGIPILSGGIAECYIAIYKASFLIISNSTFSYFPIKTKTIKPIVIAPRYWARFGNSYSRWASPANIYCDWLWQDYYGNLLTYDECYKEAKITEEFYKNNYYVLTNSSSIISKGVEKFIPLAIKNILKLILSYIFPKYF